MSISTLNDQIATLASLPRNDKRFRQLESNRYIEYSMLQFLAHGMLFSKPLNPQIVKRLWRNAQHFFDGVVGRHVLPDLAQDFQNCFAAPTRILRFDNEIDHRICLRISQKCAFAIDIPCLQFAHREQRIALSRVAQARLIVFVAAFDISRHAFVEPIGNFAAFGQSAHRDMSVFVRNR